MKSLPAEQLWCNLSIQDTALKLNADSVNGLSDTEAQKRLIAYGLNQLPEPSPPSFLSLFLHQFSNLIVWILIFAAIISGFLREIVDSLAILAIVFLNAVIGFVQEFKAARSIAALKKLSIPTCKVIREGILQTKLTKEIAPGDLVFIEAGDLIPADGRIVYSALLSIEEASLTGESVSAHKTTSSLPNNNIPIGDRKNMAFMGTTVATGKGRLLVTETGILTELGKIASLLSSQKEKPTPLQVRLKQLGNRLIFFCLGIVLVVFLIGLLRGNDFVGVFLTATSLAVAAIPEGLPVIVTIALAIGVRRMIKRKALIRQLPAVETLGCTSIICTDKTGTLTKNEMCVRKIWVDGKYIDISGIGYSPQGNFTLDSAPIQMSSFPDLQRLLEIGVLCNSSNLNNGVITGDPTEAALLVVAEKAGLKKGAVEKRFPFAWEIPFDSERKRMSIIRKTGDKNMVFTKGAPDILLNLSRSLLVNGEKMDLTQSLKEEILKATQTFGSEALRVIAMAYRENPSPGHEEEDLIFVGLVGMIDPPRSEVKEAINRCLRAGVFPVVITGDHKETAVAVAKEIGLMREGLRAIDGGELQNMSDEQLKKSLRSTCIYARVSAEHKFRIVQAWREQKEIVAVTGDGVNDAPAIKAADIGIAMGIKGTDVAKEAADMIITDDNFASIVSAIEEGRGIYDNIIKFVNYLLSSNIAELLVIFTGMAIGFRDPQGNLFVSLSAVQLLFLNLVTDGFPAVALAMDPTDPKVMTRPPRKSDEPILPLRFLLRLFFVSIIIAIGVLIACHFGLRTSAALAQTMALTTFVVLELVRVQMVREQYHIGFFSNRLIIAALLGSLIIQIMVIYLPLLQRVFGTVGLGWKEWGLILGIALVAWIFGNVIDRVFKLDFVHF